VELDATPEQIAAWLEAEMTRNPPPTLRVPGGRNVPEVVREATPDGGIQVAVYYRFVPDGTPEA
jgi:hypothetical protein